MSLCVLLSLLCALVGASATRVGIHCRGELLRYTHTGDVGIEVVGEGILTYGDGEGLEHTVGGEADVDVFARLRADGAIAEGFLREGSAKNLDLALVVLIKEDGKARGVVDAYGSA